MTKEEKLERQRKRWHARSEQEKEARRERNRGYREANREAYNEKSRKWLQAHREEVNKKKRQRWLLRDKKEIEKRREHNRQWRAANLEKIKARDKVNRARIRERERARRLSNPEQFREKVKRYRKTAKGKAFNARQKARRRALGFTPLNQPFPGSHAHHVDKERVIYMPAEIHDRIAHSILRNRNMGKINQIAFSFLEERRLS